LRKTFNGNRWVFSEGRNALNAVSHCDIAWAGALATHAHTERKGGVGAAVVYDNGWFDGKTFHAFKSDQPCVARFESGSKLHALHTLRAIWFRLCQAEDRRALHAAVTEELPPTGFSPFRASPISTMVAAWVPGMVSDFTH
jgi:hypothetical protein